MSDLYDYQCLNDANAILKSIGMPEKLHNARCVMIFAALAEMKAEDTKWRNASESYHSIHEILDFINHNYPNKAGRDQKGYAENSRETFRDETIKPWIAAGIIEAKPGLATNDRGNAYRFTAYFASLIHSFGTTQWEEQLKDYLETHEEYSSVLKQVKKIERDYVFSFNEAEIHLKKSPHNKLQMDIIQQLLPLISTGKPELLYIGDAVDRDMVQENARLQELGIHVLSDSAKLPDIIAYDPMHKRILFIEAYNSGGAFTLERVREIKSFCRCSDDTEAAFITAFDTTKKMLRSYSTVAWDTEIWVAEDATHLTHKNGDKFIGRKL